MTEPLQPNRTPSTPPQRSRHSRRLAASIIAGVAILGTAVGAGVAVADSGGSSATMAAAAPSTTMPATASAATPNSAAPKAATPKAKAGGKHHAGTKAVDPARQAWAHKYGLDRATMPNLPDVAAASPQQQAAATDLLVRTEAATAAYSDLAKAKAAGFDLQASLAKAEAKRPGLAAAIQRVDAGGTPSGRRMPMVHVANKANHTDGKVLDPSAPETLMYSYQGHGQWMLIGVMYTANEAYPQAPPDPGGPITRWHYHDRSGGQNLMMHIFFVPGNDLAHAYAAEMTS